MHKNKIRLATRALLLLLSLLALGGGARAALPGDAALWYSQPPRVPLVDLYWPPRAPMSAWGCRPIFPA